ncbi:hypothetical protein [Puniceicoccus vermicola]|uniref:Sialate O-acetylesterase n=1 Tax=Puniceicoccus vermicola TaxID=388746 RepID=A0A7X1B166_9BACT|nr:hypothetical protein [Puniceicoccus vermicola]MBC2602623.1 hypothetical protein [Puniceicoccus vermicola]
MATAIDIGDADNIHPPNKQEVGRRLSLCADRVAHGLPVLSSGPRVKNISFEGEDVRVRFDRVGEGLRGEGDWVSGFAVAGEDRQFYWAHARIEGKDTVVLSSERVSNPVSVHYAWAGDPFFANLRNSDGLPAEPFRTDEWLPYEQTLE